MSFLALYSPGTDIEDAMALSRKKAILFSIVPTFFFLLLLILVEIGLRIFAPSLSSPLFFPAPEIGVRVNRGYLSKFFPASAPLIPELKPTALRSPKPPGSFRVLCLGESSMFGVPYEMTANIPAIFRKQLWHAMPGREVDVVNLAASAINTNVIKELAKESLPLEPDLVLIYTGHNEFYGPDGVGASFLERHFPFLTGWKYQLRDLRLVRLVQNALHSMALKNAGELNLMKQVSQEAWVDLDSDDARRIFSLFEGNLREILSMYRERHIPVIVSDVTSNLMFAPFASALPGQLDDVRAAMNSGQTQEAQSLVERLALSNPSNAAVWYWQGQVALAMGDNEAAHAALSRARDLDMLKFRAPEQVNEVTRRVCREMNVPCVSADTLFASLSPKGIPGFDLFWEHLHPKVRGYYEIAEMFFREALRRGLVPDAALPRPLPFNTDTLAICWLDQAYGDLSIRALTSRWPFENVKVQPVVFLTSSENLKDIALQVYSNRLGWTIGCLRSAAELHRAGMYRAAATTYQAMIDEWSEGYYTRYLYGTVLKDSGDIPGALSQYAASIRLNPQYPYSRVDMGLIEINRGNFGAAERQLKTALDLSRQEDSPEMLQASIYYGLAAIAANKGDFATAVADLDNSLQLVPSYGPAKALKEAINRR